MSKQGFLAIGAVATAFALLATGCGGGDETAATAPVSTTRSQIAAASMTTETEEPADLTNFAFNDTDETSEPVGL